MYKELFYHKQDIFVWGILGLYHIRLIVCVLYNFTKLDRLEFS